MIAETFMSRRYTLIFLMSTLLAGWTARAQVTPFPAAPTYKQRRTWHEQALTVGGTRSQRLDWLRQIVRSGPYGERGLNRIFKNLSGQWSVDPTIPGVETNLRMTASLNPAVRKGAARTHVYATRIYNDSRFDLLAVNRRVYGGDGAMVTDKDIVYRHRDTRQTGHIEVKDLTTESQRRSLDDCNRKVDQMYLDQRRTGRLQAFVNRRAVIPELKAYAQQRGVLVYEQVISGERAPAGNEVHFRNVLDHLDQANRVTFAKRITSGGAAAGVGGWLVASTAPDAIRALRLSLDPATRSRQTLLQLGERGTQTIAGTAMLVEGTTIIGSKWAAEARAARLLTVSKWGGRTGLAMFVASEGFLVWQYAAGTMNNRDFYTAQAGLGGGVVGGVVGGWGGAAAGAASGAAIGSIFPGVGTATGAAVGAVVGGIAGAVGGGYAGSGLALAGIERYYRTMDERQRIQFDDFVYAYYGATR